MNRLAGAPKPIHPVGSPSPTRALLSNCGTGGALRVRRRDQPSHIDWQQPRAEDCPPYPYPAESLSEKDGVGTLG